MQFIKLISLFKRIEVVCTCKLQASKRHCIEQMVTGINYNKNLKDINAGFKRSYYKNI